MNEKIVITDFCGGCPKCGRNDGQFNAGAAHWFVCHEHKVMWTIGTNLFSGWRDETEAEQREKWRRIDDYEEVTEGILWEGIWSRDPETRRRELENYDYESAVAEVEAEIARQRREVLTEAVEVLKRLPPEGTPRETISITVDDGVRVEFGVREPQDPPF